MSAHLSSIIYFLWDHLNYTFLYHQEHFYKVSILISKELIQVAESLGHWINVPMMLWSFPRRTRAEINSNSRNWIVSVWKVYGIATCEQLIRCVGTVISRWSCKGVAGHHKPDNEDRFHPPISTFLWTLEQISRTFFLAKIICWHIPEFDNQKNIGISRIFAE